MKKVYVLTSRCGTGLNDPKVFFKKDLAKKIMKEEYEKSLQDYDREDYNDAYIEENQAAIEAFGDYQEWFINECEVL